MNFYAITACYLLVGGLGVGIFLYGKPDGNSLFDKLYRIVCQKFPWALKKVLEKTCGKRAPAFLDWLWNYVCYTSNPIVQIFYLCVVVGGFLTFVAHGFPHLPNRLAGSTHKYLGFMVFITCLSVWYRACTLDPGVITPQNAEALCKVWPWDNIIFQKAECKTCGTVKPARSKHCSLSNVCVARFDHYCIWLNNAVGVGNHRWFLGFLFWHLVLTFYGSGMGTTILYDIVVQKDLFNAVFVDPVSKEKHKASKLIVMQYLLATEGMLIFVTMLSAIMGLVLCGFFIWHLNLVRIGMTTNELSKWNYLKWCLKHEGEEGKEKLKSLENKYDLGFWGNFKEVFCPIDVHSFGKPEEPETTRSDARTGGKKEEGRRKGKDKAKKT